MRQAGRPTGATGGSRRGFLAGSMFASPGWQWPIFAAIVLLSGTLNFLNLNREGYANTYYAAAVRSMLTSWHSFFFVSFDPGGFVTVDKPPVGFWIQTASAWLFGFSGWSVLAPEAFAGVLSVVVLYFLVRRTFGSGAGLAAALVLAVTPITVATDRNNTIDGLLVLALLLAAWAFSIAAATGRLRWLLLGAVVVGVGFNIKMLEAFLPLPAFFLLYLVAAPLSRRLRLVHLSLASVVLVAVSLSWATAVDLTPADQRPYVGSSTNNTVFELIVGHNGLDRLLPGRSMVPGLTTTRSSRGGTTAGGASNATPNGSLNPSGDLFGAFETGQPGPLRLFSQQLAGQISWLLLPSILGWVVIATRDNLRDTRNERQRGLVLWGMWLLTEVVFFSVANMFHPYYMVTLAPAIAALAGAGVVTLWQEYQRPGYRGWLLPLGIGMTALLQWSILAGYPTWGTRLGLPILFGGVVSALVLVVARCRPRRLAPSSARLAAIAALTMLLVGPIVWSAIPVATASANQSRIPQAGPALPDRGRFGGTSGGRSPQQTATDRPIGGELMSTTDPKLVAFLEANNGATPFLLATPNAMAASPIILATGKPVMALGGFMGSDPILTLDQLKADVQKGEVRYFLLPSDRVGRPGFGFRMESQAGLTNWVTTSCSAVSSQLWQSAPAAPETSQATGLPDFASANQLYDCAAPRSTDGH